MLLENSQQAESAARDVDVCVIGTGPAGMSLAIQLESRGLRVLVLEAGGQTYDEQSQAQFEGRIVGDQRFDMGINRLRYFGGCSNHWGGFCRPLEEWDFRDKIPGMAAAWPISRRDLDPFLDRAHDILELPCFRDDRPLNGMINHVHFSYSPTVNFAIKYREHVRASRKLHVALNSCLSNLVERSGRIDAIEVCDPQNNRRLIRAPLFALCAGGIENSRLLLWANTRNEGRVVRQANALGKYWMEHPHFTVADALVKVDPRLDPDRQGRAYIAPTEKAIRERKMLNCGLRFEPTNYDGTKQLVADLACVAPRVGKWVGKLAGKSIVCGVRVRAAWEQGPVESNHVRLGSKPDAMGIPQAELHWKLGELERHTAAEAVTLLGEYLAEKDYGRVRLAPWLADRTGFPEDDEYVGNHHMGGTRMSADPRTGVVDAHCKVHGLTNLFIGGSSVFPSAGHANPTLTIVQLALRLAAHLEQISKAGARA